jgi:hypothetical protein
VLQISNSIKNLALDRKAALIDLYQAHATLAALQSAYQKPSSFHFQSQYLSGVIDFLSCAELSSKLHLSGKNGLKCVTEFERLQTYFTELSYCHFGVDMKSRKYLSYLSYLAYLCKRAVANRFQLNV